ncbi:hypothetical protein [Burkholderia pseudomallei]|uniref:hypothetical protein n=1 Tax=Burkholderia pseudomallei TaxID=28450 RepID=UPI000B278140|nr:hypothetical protein [Burkholderia pseudomallei]MBF3379255.1 hypothetical protein [Burkholderia pseudomallei]MBF3406769.1 hypothetical protein [Burkholderia pseudomallei]
MAASAKTLKEIRKWGREFCKRDARAAAAQSATKQESTMGLSKALAESRRRAGDTTASDVTKTQTGTARFVQWVNGVAKDHENADRAAAERAAQRVQKDGAAGTNARQGDSSDGSGAAQTRASTADGPQSLWGFFNKNWRR